MIIFPLLTFFVVQYLSNGNSLVSGGLAALVANMVLIGYVIAAFVEDTRSDEELEKDKKRQ